MYSYVLSHPEIKTVILSMTPWDIRNMEMPNLAAQPSLADRFTAIRPLVVRDVAALVAAGKKVIATFDTPALDREPRNCFRQPTRCVMSARTGNHYLQPYVQQWNALFAGLPDVCVFAQAPLFRLPNGDFAITQDGLILFRDDHHLSYFGSAQVARLFSRSPCFDKP
jgi:hypothetical protein